MKFPRINLYLKQSDLWTGQPWLGRRRMGRTRRGTAGRGRTRRGDAGRGRTRRGDDGGGEPGVATPDGATPGGDGETRALAASEIGDETSSWSRGWIGDGETRALCGRVICFFSLVHSGKIELGPVIQTVRSGLMSRCLGPVVQHCALVHLCFAATNLCPSNVVVNDQRSFCECYDFNLSKDLHEFWMKYVRWLSVNFKKVIFPFIT
jgi:hypothetical protein